MEQHWNIWRMMKCRSALAYAADTSNGESKWGTHPWEDDSAESVAGVVNGDGDDDIKV